MSPSWATKSVAAIASVSGGGILWPPRSCKADVEDEHHNATRFLIMARDAERAPNSGKVVTSLVFQVKNVPAALYKAMGGFATNGVQHDQAGKLSDGRLVQRHALLCRHPGPSRPAACEACP